MDTLPSREISVLEPVGAAFEKTSEILFRPFDLHKWFVLGFCAWLATLGERMGGGGGGSGGGGPVNIDNQPSGTHQFHQELHNFKESVISELPVVITVAVVVLVLVLAISFVVMWLKSRGQFMFLHGVARNAAQVAEPWKRYARQANSLFGFKVILWLAGFGVSLLLMIPLILFVLTLAESDFKFMAPAAIIPAVCLVLGFIGFCIALTVINVLTHDFVVPIMYLNGCTVTEGWKRFWALCRSYPGTFILFLLILVVVNMVIGMLIVLLIVATCCCAACILIIPYIGTVALLPVYVWRRAYSALLLAQFGPEFDVFASPAQAVMPAVPETEQNF